MPSLASRKSDIILLAEHFIEKMNLRYAKKITRISPRAMNALMDYPWPGNVRELENSMERAVLTAQDDCIRVHNLPPSLQPETDNTPASVNATGSLSSMLANFEKEILQKALERHHGNISATGRELGVSPRMMNYKIHKFSLKVPH